MIANYVPLQDAYGGPNYFALDPAADYNIHIDSDGDAVEDLTFQFNFNNSLAADGADIQLDVGPDGDKKQIAIPLKNAGGISAGDSSVLNFNEEYTLNLVEGPVKTGSSSTIPAVPASQQSPYGVVGDDLTGFPNGRRPGDDVVDIALRVVMGRLCHEFPVNGTPTSLGYCAPADANVGTAPFTDGAPLSATDLDEAFPYLKTPVAGSPN